MADVRTSTSPFRFPEKLGRFTLLRLIGSGSTGWVFEARDSDGSPVAIKLIHPHLAASLSDRLVTEVRLAQTVDSPGALRLLEAGTDDGQAFLVMELVRGQSLADLIRSRGTLEPGESTAIAAAIARSLQDLHQAGIVHRDVKPSNVLLGDDGRVVLTDYGVAREILASVTTQSVNFAGSLAYAAPEQATEKWDHRVDIYALGATLVHMLTGSPPERHGLLSALPRGLGRSLPEQLASANARLSEIAIRCLELDPRDRYSSAAEALDDLKALQEPRPLLARVAQTVAMRRTRRRVMTAMLRPRAVAMLALVAIISIGALVYSLTQSGDAQACEIEQPADLRVEQGAEGQAVVTWARQDDCPPADYQVAYSERDGRDDVTPGQVLNTGITDGRRAARFVLNGLPVGSTVHIWVEPLDANGRPGPSARTVFLSGTGCEQAPPPLALQALGASANAAQLRWESGGQCTAGFFVYYANHDRLDDVNEGERPTDGVIDVGTNTQWTVPNLRTGETYWFWVLAYGAGGVRSTDVAGPVTASLHAEPTTGAELIAPMPGSTITQRSMTFRWTEGKNNIKFDLWVSGVKPGGSDIFDARDGPDTAAEVSGIPVDGRAIYVTLISADGSDAGLSIRHYQFLTIDDGSPREQRSFELQATQSWLETGVEFRQGDRVQIEASGAMFRSPADPTGWTPDGGCPPHAGMLVEALPCMALIGQYLGVAPFEVGSRLEFIAERAGNLVLGVNDSEHRDNTGSWTVRITVSR